MMSFACNDRKKGRRNHTPAPAEINATLSSRTAARKTEQNVLVFNSTKAIRRFLLPALPPRTGGSFLHQKNSWQINALPLGLIKLEGIKTTERLLWWTQCCASCALCSGGNFCHLASAPPAAPRWTRSNTVKFL